MIPTAVPHRHHHLDYYNNTSHCQHSLPKKHMRSPPHPHAHGYHRRRLASPISPLSTTYNTRSLNKTKEEVIAACDREVQWSFELEYGRTIERFMYEAEVYNFGYLVF